MACLQPTNVLGSICSCTLTSGCAVCASACGELVGYTPVSGGVTSVGLTMPPAFTVCNSPVTSCGTLAVTGAGLASQYIRGDGTLQAFPSSSGGGASLVYYFNGGVASSVGGYQQMSYTANTGTAADFTISGNGLIAQFLTDVGSPNTTTIPVGNWNFEVYFGASSNGGVPKFYVELLKYNGTTFTSLASSAAVPEAITQGVVTDIYFTALAVPATTLLVTDRLAVRFYIVDSVPARDITMYTQDSHLSDVITTFAVGISTLNGLNCNTQYLTTGTACSDFTIVSSGDTHTFNLPTASATARGALSSADWTTFSSPKIIISDTGLCSTYRCGVSNCASGNYSAALSGQCNTACVAYSSVLGGSGNIASGAYSSAVGCNLTASAACTFYANNICATARINLNGAGDNSLFSLNNGGGTTYTNGFSPNMTAYSCTTLTVGGGTTYTYTGSTAASWTLPNPLGTNQMYFIKNTGTAALTINAYTATTIIDLTNTAVASINVSIGSSVTLQQDGSNKTMVLAYSDTSVIAFNRQTASYTLVLTDAGKMVEMNVATANNLTIPLNATVPYPIGQVIELTQYGAGQTTIVATSGVTIRSYTGLTKLSGQYAAATLTKIGTNEWYLFGNLTA